MENGPEVILRGPPGEIDEKTTCCSHIHPPHDPGAGFRVDDRDSCGSEAENTDLDTEYFVTEAAVTKISVDRETGEMTVVRPGERTRVLSAPLAAALSRSTEGLRVFEISGGGKGVHLEGRFQHVLIVRMKPDGSLQTVCSNRRHEAENHDHNKPVGGDTEPRDR